ncbi:MAG: hypothetical protein AVDCRST_MAG56-2913 [uncultured Cytophagales bacterium]|uniref:Uncharacterized protein n=1 Tax=uncultured Cytophagales bacterium TaxID=158755 RepID=A0A6J4J6P2_9SPHI|nr:MAG: hypothetical protein AVDCRST_MAG56-2913 [uncultured Cytophagales bacterium]
MLTKEASVTNPGSIPDKSPYFRHPPICMVLHRCTSIEVLDASFVSMTGLIVWRGWVENPYLSGYTYPPGYHQAFPNTLFQPFTRRD